MELLADGVAAGAETADAPAPASPQAPCDQPPASPETSERWAKAAGQLKPTRQTGSERPERTPSPAARPAQRGARDAAAALEPSRANEAGSHVTARDHAAAAVRPAGEPLARARDLVLGGRIHEAIELYLGILTVNPSNLKAHNNLGVLYDELKRFDAALEHFEAAARIAPDNVEVLANFASTLTSLARYEQADELLRRAQRLAPDDIQASLGIGILYFRRGLYGESEVELGGVCDRNQSNGLAFYYRGEALNRLGRFDEAAEAIERAVELLPNDPRPFYTLGHLYDRRYQLEDAAEMYRRARRLQSR